MVLGEILGWEVLVPVLLIALLFGSAKIPQLARSLGQASREFHKASTEDDKPNGDDETSGPPKV